VVDLQEAHKIGAGLFGEGCYTVERREFADGDWRTLVKHSVGWSATCYVQVTVWVGRGDVWVEYYEGDVRRCRDIHPLDEFDPTQELEKSFSEW